MNDQKGKNVVEYILLVTAVLTVFILFFNPNGRYRAAMEKGLFTDPVNRIQGLSNELQLP